MRALAIFAVIWGLLGAAFAPAIAEPLRISGSTTVANAILLPEQDRIETETGMTLEIVSNGSIFGMLDLVEGRSDVAMISAPLDLAIAKFHEQHPGRLDGVELRGHQIGDSRVAFVVHPDNPVRSITLEQLTKVMTGETVNWATLGGPDMPIAIVVEREGGGLRTLAEERLTEGQSLEGDVREFVNATQVPFVVRQLPSALGIAAPATVEGTGVALIETNEAIGQPLILVTVGAPSAAANALVAASQRKGS